MKVYEKFNQLKGTDSTLEEIANWFYMNRIYPMEILTDNALELPLNTKISKELKKIISIYDSKVLINGLPEVINMLNEEVKEQ